MLNRSKWQTTTSTGSSENEAQEAHSSLGPKERRSISAVRPVPSDRSDQLLPTGRVPAGEGPTSNSNPLD